MMIRCNISLLPDVQHFFPQKKLQHDGPADKTSEPEAIVIVRLLQSIRDLYLTNGKTLDHDVRIIAPYRNQIALIQHLLEQRLSRGRRGDDRHGERFPEITRPDPPLLLCKPTLSNAIPLQPQPRWHGGPQAECSHHKGTTTTFPYR